MFKKKEKQQKEKKVRTVKVGTHKKSVIALWVVLIASVSFGVYKNFTAIDMHTVHEKETIQLRLNDTNGIENFVKNFAKSYYTWSNSKEAIKARTQAINEYLTKELQDLNVDTIRTDIPTSSTVTDVIIWDVEQAGEDDFIATYEVDQQIKENDQTRNVSETYMVKVTETEIWLSFRTLLLPQPSRNPSMSRRNRKQTQAWTLTPQQTLPHFWKHSSSCTRPLRKPSLPTM